MYIPKQRPTYTVYVRHSLMCFVYARNTSVIYSKTAFNRNIAIK